MWLARWESRTSRYGFRTFPIRRYAANWLSPNSEGAAVIGQTRLYCSKGDGFRLIEVPTEQASYEAERLKEQGWVVDAAIPL